MSKQPRVRLETNPPDSVPPRGAVDLFFDPGTNEVVARDYEGNPVTFDAPEPEEQDLAAGIASDYLTPQTLTSGTSIAFNVALGVQAKLTLAHTATLGAPTNMSDGQTASISGVQDGSGSHPLSLNAAYLAMTSNLADIGTLTANKAFELAIKRVGSVYRVWITTQP